MATIQVFSLLRKSSFLRMSYLKCSVYTTKLIDRILNIDTISQPVKKASYNTRFDDSIAYLGYSYLKLWKYINFLKPSNEDVVFDIGCGMGRIL
jgi:hypothetical protein